MGQEELCPKEPIKDELQSKTTLGSLEKIVSDQSIILLSRYSWLVY